MRRYQITVRRPRRRGSKTTESGCDALSSTATDTCRRSKALIEASDELIEACDEHAALAGSPA